MEHIVTQVESMITVSCRTMILLLALSSVFPIKISAFHSHSTHNYNAPRSSVLLPHATKRISLPHLPDLNYGLSDEEFKIWLTSQIENVPGRHLYSDVYEDSIKAIINWRKRYRGNPTVWKRIFSKDRVVKELIESAPIIQAVKTIVESNANENENENGNNEKFTILDLCSGKGYLSMFLSEMLPPEKVQKFILIDKAWAIASVS